MEPTTNPKRKLFDLINATQFLPFCGIEMTAMTRHKIRGLNGNSKPVDFSADEWQKIEKGIQKMAKKFSGTTELTVQDIIENPVSGHYFKVKNGRGIYAKAESTTGTLAIIYRAHKGVGKDAKRWVAPNTPVELVPFGYSFKNEKHK